MLKLYESGTGTTLAAVDNNVLITLAFNSCRDIHGNTAGAITRLGSLDLHKHA